MIATLSFSFMRLFGVEFIHAVFKKRSAVLAFQVPLIRQILAGIHLVLRAHIAGLLNIGSLVEAVLHEVFPIVTLEPFLVGEIIAGLYFVLLGRLGTIPRCRARGAKHCARRKQQRDHEHQLKRNFLTSLMRNVDHRESSD